MTFYINKFFEYKYFILFHFNILFLSSSFSSMEEQKNLLLNIIWYVKLMYVYF